MRLLRHFWTFYFLTKIFYTHKKHKNVSSIERVSSIVNEVIRGNLKPFLRNIKLATFFLLDIFMRIIILCFLFLFTCMYFLLFVRVKSSRKKKRKRDFKLPLITSSTILLKEILYFQKSSVVKALMTLLIFWWHLWHCQYFNDFV